ncbi:MAG: hypothetical protein ABJF10_08165 [Chthoniobacter sp.]|uniref:hypothetical protein n=1 Tax=Chthoniobacter sp. TaxID=2510640 RepID=UPI0032A9E8CA
MKPLLLAVTLLLHLATHGLAKTRPLPDVPPSALTVAQVLDIARRELGSNGDTVILVGVDWCKTSQFQPRYTTGGEFFELRQNPDEYCWFVTYLDKKADPALPADRQKFREMTVIRIKNDGTAHRLGYIRT